MEVNTQAKLLLENYIWTQSGWTCVNCINSVCDSVVVKESIWDVKYHYPQQKNKKHDQWKGHAALNYDGGMTHLTFSKFYKGNRCTITTSFLSCCWVMRSGRRAGIANMATCCSISSSQLTSPAWVSWKCSAKGRACSRTPRRSELKADTVSILSRRSSIFSRIVDVSSCWADSRST